MRSLCLGLFAAIFVVGCQEKKDGVAPGPTPGMPGSPGTPPAPPKADPLAEVSGTIKGKAFKPDSVKLEGRKISFRKGKDFFADMQIDFDLPQVEGKLEGKEWNFSGDIFENPTLTVAAREGENLPKTDFVWPKDYTMILKITKHTSKVIEGTIDLKVTNPANTSLAGKFAGIVKKTGTDPLDADDAPYVQGKIVMKGDWKEERLAVGFQAKGVDGKSFSNMVGSSVTTDGGGGPATNLSFEPQLTSLLNDEKDGPRYVHSRVAPGEFLVYVRRGGVLAAWKNITVKPGDQLNVDLTIDLANVGSFVVTLPDEEVIAKDETNLKKLQLIPDGIVTPTDFNPFLFDAGEAKKGEKTITVKNVPAGKYKAVFRNSEAMVEVVAGKESTVTLVRKKK